MRSTTFYRPCALLVKAALIADARHCFDEIVVENDHGTVVLSGVLPEIGLAFDAGEIAAGAAGNLVVNNIVVPGAIN
jgi:hypothetical protein